MTMNGQEFVVDVYPQIPERIARLEELANDLWYSWHRPARALFGRLDPDLWQRVGHNPKLFLKRLDQHRLEAASADEVFISNYHKVLSTFDTYHRESARQQGALRLAAADLVAYFCAEYGLHESLPIYSGGLGILAGHHCKAASDIRLQFVAVGLLYGSGYFSQEIDEDGNQIARYVESAFENLPVSPALDSSGAPIEVAIDFPGHPVYARVWRAIAGHVYLYLLDTNVPENHEEDRSITHLLYGGDRETRIKQELVLGIGGVRALRALGLAPTVWHMNEGHPAFMVLERIRELVTLGQDFDTALELVAATSVFTTHTPVPAGHDQFPEPMVTHYLAPLRAAIGIDDATLLGLGRVTNGTGEFNMTTLAIRGSRHHNGVSRLHGQVSAALCAPCWPQIPPEENPMDYITNGVHVPTVLSEEWGDLFDRFLGIDWRNKLSDVRYWQGIEQIPDHLFWSVSQSIKSRMLHTVRESITAQHFRNQLSEAHLERILRHIDPSDPNVLTVGFARRFATYKRATLIFNDLDWLRELTSSGERPVVFVFGGKAHPADGPGQQLLKAVHRVAAMQEFVGKVLLVEGYDLGMARRLVAGVDVWLNNPIHALEASGTSGMKAAVNGTINLSVTDGWWAEGFRGDNGWAIRPSPHGDDSARRDAEEARTLYEILQDDVIPLYYDRGKYGYSERWVALAKRSMATVLPRFNMLRVVNEYIAKLYAPAAAGGRSLAADSYARAQELAGWKARVREAWGRVRIRRLDPPIDRLAYGQALTVAVAVDMNGLEPGDVVVEALLSGRGDPGPVAGGNTPDDPMVKKPRSNGEARIKHASFAFAQRLPDTREHEFRIELAPEWCGRLKYRIRMYPSHPCLSHPLETGLLTWL